MHLPENYYHCFLGNGLDAALVGPTSSMVTDKVGVDCCVGIPFPGLLRMAAEDQSQIALLWAINGAFSVLGSTLALVISMQWGFRWAMLGGAAAYMLMAGLVLVLARVRRPMSVTPSVVDKTVASRA